MFRFWSQLSQVVASRNTKPGFIKNYDAQKMVSENNSNKGKENTEPLLIKSTLKFGFDRELVANNYKNGNFHFYVIPLENRAAFKQLCPLDDSTKWAITAHVTVGVDAGENVLGTDRKAITIITTHAHVDGHPARRPGDAPIFASGESTNSAYKKGIPQVHLAESPVLVATEDVSKYFKRLDEREVAELFGTSAKKILGNNAAFVENARIKDFLDGDVPFKNQDPILFTKDQYDYFERNKLLYLSVANQTVPLGSNVTNTGDEAEYINAPEIVPVPLSGVAIFRKPTTELIKPGAISLTKGLKSNAHIVNQYPNIADYTKSELHTQTVCKDKTEVTLKYFFGEPQKNGNVSVFDAVSRDYIGEFSPSTGKLDSQAMATLLKESPWVKKTENYFGKKNMHKETSGKDPTDVSSD